MALTYIHGYIYPKGVSVIAFHPGEMYTTTY